MNLTMIFFFITMILMLIIMMLIIMIGKKSIIEYQKSTPFECGFNPISHKRLPFSIHFFLIAVLFLIFDIEIIIILPMILTMYNVNMMTWLLTSIMFILILMIGLYHEWYNGMLNWAK
ncbi:NADH dehydrogenase subunit 3 (mitochondrion) [Homalodisca vitripennis]|nr:NADH dehydrogenase subunit 3 [Homalodisca vitripennis]